MSAIITVIALAIIIFVCWKQNQSQSQTLEELRKTISEQHTTIYNLTTELNNVKAELSKMKNPAGTITEAVVNEVVSRILQSKVFTDAKVLRETQQKVIDSLTADVAKGKEAILQIKEAQQKAIASVAAEVTKVKDAFQQAQSKLSDAVVDGVIGKIKDKFTKGEKADTSAKQKEVIVSAELPEDQTESNDSQEDKKVQESADTDSKHSKLSNLFHRIKKNKSYS